MTARPGAAPVLTADLPSGPVAYTEMGAGTPLLLVHGLGNCSRFWALVARDLASTHRVVAIDLPGFGASPRPRAWLDVRRGSQALHELAHAIGIGRAAVVGHSLGSLVATDYARRHPDSVSRVVLVGGALGEVFRTFARPWRPLQHPRFAAGIAAQVLGAGFPVPAALREAALQDPVVRRLLLAPFVARSSAIRDDDLVFALDSLGRPSVFLAVAAGFSYDLDAALRSLPCDLVLVNGSEDRVSRLQDVDAVVAAVPGSRSVILDGVGHWPMLEAPSRLAQAMRDLENTQPAPS